MAMSTLIIPLMCQSWALSMSFMNFCSSVFQSIIHIGTETGKLCVLVQNHLLPFWNLTTLFLAPGTFNYFTTLQLILRNYTVSQSWQSNCCLAPRFSHLLGTVIVTWPFCRWVPLSSLNTPNISQFFWGGTQITQALMNFKEERMFFLA